MPEDIRPGVAVELAAGLFNVAVQWRYSALGLQWWLWELADSQGRPGLLARVDETYYQPVWEIVATLPETPVLDLDGVVCKLRHRGEARAERSSEVEHDFWLADFRHYAAPGRVAILTADRDETHRLQGSALDSALVRVYQP